jgi:anti-sigma regulatory factor (Ser/Thr protein kinase)/DNA-binding NarL/FixJ family response regulator
VSRVLIIGGFPSLREYLVGHSLLRDDEIDSCEDSVTAVRYARERAVDVAVTDPITSMAADLALAAEIRSWRPETKVIALARFVGPDDVIAALRAQVFACFAAPLDTAEIASMVSAALAARDWHDAIQVVSGLRNWLTLKLSPRLLTAERVVRFVTEMQSGLDCDERDQLIMAFREMLLNAIEHGAGFETEKTIEVTAARTARTIVYHFRDPGAGFDPANVAHAAASTDPEDIVAATVLRANLGMRAGGLGMLIARSVIDEIAYNERGNEVILIKHLDKTNAPGEDFP